MNGIISKNKSFKEYNHADQIIKYLMGDESVQLTDTEKTKLDNCRMIHGFRMKFMRKSDLVNVIERTMNIGARQAYNLINETERIFGSVNPVHKDYERQFCLDMSRKNLEIAYESRNTIAISKALVVHAKLAGLEEQLPELPDFAALEQHKYVLTLSKKITERLEEMLKPGAVDLDKVIQRPNLNDFDAEDVNETV